MSSTGGNRCEGLSCSDLGRITSCLGLAYLWTKVPARSEVTELCPKLFTDFLLPECQHMVESLDLILGVILVILEGRPFPYETNLLDRILQQDVVPCCPLDNL